ncbi:trypsin-like peptidase domain-containing protein [Erysipelotrichaceae bacterium RD49]|nr:trypsin-like peptidase domain-containing protein [Erysipelotrichaceae bacterium RD49]
MANNIPPRVPKRRNSSRNGTIIGISAAIGISAVLLSGVAGYAGASYAIDQKQSNSVSTTIPNSNSSFNNGNTNITVMDVSDTVAKLRPSVVEISTESVTSGNSIFGQYVSQGAGSGVILSEDGYIVTNNHVVNGASSMTVKTYDGQEYPATLVGTDPQTDVAVIKIDATGLTPAVVGSSDDIRVGQAAIAIGNPLGSLGGTVTTGIISAVGREITIDNETMTLLQTDAAINPGNSGGGLFDVNGQLIGIVNAKQSDTGIEGLGFAIPISDVTSVIDDLVKNGKVTSRPVLNVSLQQVQDSQYYGQNRTMEPGVYIVQIVEGGTADLAGLQIGDRIISFDGQDVTNSTEVKQILKKHHVGDVVNMVIDRNGETMEIEVELKGSASE